MFYLKYRPQKFSELVRPNEIAESLAAQVQKNNLSHAYLFVGPRGTGKTTTARLLAKAANCTNILPNGDPCDECENCLAIKRGNFLDLIEIDAASNRGIDDIRNLRDRIGLAPSQGTKKVYIIDEVHMLTKEAFNALLKTLEEPPEHAIFVLCTTEPHKVLDTIKSRCQIYNFKRATLDQLKNKLEYIVEEEGLEVDKDIISKIAQASFGGYRDAETMLQQVVHGSLDSADLFGFSSYEGFYKFVDSLLNLNSTAALDFLEEKYGSGLDMQVWSYSLLDYLKELLFLKMGTSTKLLDITEEMEEKMESQADRFNTSDLVFCVKNFLQARNQIAESNISALPLELAVVEVCSEWGSDEEKPSDFGGGNNFGSKKKGKVSTDKEKDSEKTELDDVESNADSGVDAEETDQNDNPVENAAKKGDKDDGKKDDSVDLEITLEAVKKKWNEVLRSSKKYNHSVRALLKSGRVIGLEGSAVVLEVQFAFHKDRLECAKNREIVETVFKEVFDLPLTILCSVVKSKASKRGKETGNLTDLNIVRPNMANSGEVDMDDSLLDVFDGSLPGL